MSVTRMSDPAALPEAARPRLAALLCAAAVLAVCTTAAFWPVTSHRFLNWDDQTSVALNPDYRDVSAARLARYWTSTVGALYVPVTYTTWGIVAPFAQRDKPDEMGSYLDARPFHLLNLAFHVANGVLVFAVLVTLLPNRPGAAWAGAMLFALHPLHAEPVSWVSSMYTTLSTLFSLLALWAYVRYAQLARRDDASETRSRRRALLVAAGVAFMLAILTKPFAVTLPIIAAAIDWLLVGRDPRRAWLPVTVALAVALPVIVVTKLAQPAVQVSGTNVGERLLVAGDAAAFYMKKMVLPLRLVPDYGRSPEWVLSRKETYAVAAVPVLIGVACLLAWRRRPWLLTGFIIFMAAAAPALGLAPFDYQVYSTVADRYAYFSVFGVALVVAFALASLPTARARSAGIACAIVAAAGLGVLAFRQAARWHDSQTLFSYTLSVNPRSLAAHRIFGFLASQRGDDAEAMRHYEAALATYPRDPLVLYNVGNYRLRVGDPQGAADYFRRSIEANPRLVSPRLNLAAILASNGYFDEAIEQYERVLQREPNHPEVRAMLDRARALRARAASRPAA